MENEKETQPEMTPPSKEESSQSEAVLSEENLPKTEAEPVEEAAPVLEKKPTPPWLRKGLVWAGIILVSLLIGFGLAYFLLYVPQEQARFDAERELSRLTKQIGELEAELSQTHQQLQETQNQLEQTDGELKALQYSSALTALQLNVTYARLALVTKDLLTARQELSSASTNLKRLIPMIGDKDIENALTERLAKVRSSVTSDPEKSLEELRILAENLSRLEKP